MRRAQTAQHLAGTAFGNAGRHRARQRVHAVGPAHRQVKLPCERIADRGDARMHGRIDILDDGNRRLAPAISCHRFGKAIGCFAHQRRSARER